MGKPGFVEARPKGGGDVRLVPVHYLTNEAFGFVEVASIRNTGKKAVRRPDSGDAGQEDSK
ncbi:hypothetical protein [Glutamicibacter sp.]|jgi:hypothetical protein|uniref:hypothetical protein n=1 Tax=Glutamicibacter sp. TaxID=1931995 RepID=UPI002B48669A|nr:hypothetical protein [Glutamicibacter sp.]HJX78562.1 hypothetical protein [Glutamicibacter sp.]